MNDLSLVASRVKEFLNNSPYINEFLGLEFIREFGTNRELPVLVFESFNINIIEENEVEIIEKSADFLISDALSLRKKLEMIIDKVY